jgi:LAGLIDADG endonuclease
MKITNIKKKINITNDWISGFTQSDGSFVISYSTIKTSRGIPVRPIPVFNITQSLIDYDLFIEIQKYLGIGKVYKNRQNVTFVVKSIDEIVNVLLPLFDKHPLRGSKYNGYNIFKAVVLLIKDKRHLTLEGTIQILNLSYFMNKETSLRTENTKEILLNKLKLKYGVLPIVPSLLAQAKGRSKNTSFRSL